MIKFSVLNRWSGEVQFTAEIDANEDASCSLKLGLAVKWAIANSVRIGSANLTRANLTRANLNGADLTDANLTRANLTRANLTRANLTRANLNGADLTRANLTGADLTRANLTRANLTRANLTGANLTSANLTRADLNDADLTRANLTRANLTRADLNDADLTSANLTRADLTAIRDDLWAVLSSTPAEVPGLIAALKEGRVDGSTYTGDCACLVGTLANVRGCGVECIPGLMPNSSRPIERFFMAIKVGDTPENSQAANLAHGWATEWLAKIRGAFALAAV